MSLPTFPKIDPPLSREGSLNEIISSIAAEELSLSHILNAEGERLQYILGTLPGLEEVADFDEVSERTGYPVRCDGAAGAADRQAERGHESPHSSRSHRPHRPCRSRGSC